MYAGQHLLGRFPGPVCDSNAGSCAYAALQLGRGKAVLLADVPHVPPGRVVEQDCVSSNSRNHLRSRFNHIARSCHAEHQASFERTNEHESYPSLAARLSSLPKVLCKASCSAL